MKDKRRLVHKYLKSVFVCVWYLRLASGALAHRPCSQFYLPASAWFGQKMPHDHSHGGCGEEGHDHDIPEAQGHRDNLYTRIDRDNIVALNVQNGHGPEVVKPWHERMDEGVVSLVTWHALLSKDSGPLISSLNRTQTTKCMHTRHWM